MKLLTYLTYLMASSLLLISGIAAAKSVDTVDPIAMKGISPCEQSKYFKYSKDGNEFQDPDWVIRQLSECLASLSNAPATYKAATLTMRSIAFAQQSEYNQAIADREESLSLIPARTAWDIIGLASLYRKNRQPERALEVLRKMLQDNLGVTGKGTPPGMPSYYNLGLTLIDLGRWLDAAETFSEGMTYQPDYVWAYAYRSLAYDRMNQPELARADIEKARLLLKRLTGDALENSRRDILKSPFLELMKKYPD